MSGYRSVISSIEDWQTKTDAEIVAEATAKNIPFADPEWWSSFGVASVIGAENVTPLLERIRLTNFAWVADAITGSKAPFGDLAVNSMMLASGDPDLIKLAQATRYNMSLCQKFGVQEDHAAIAATAEIMRLDILRKALIQIGADRWNLYHKAVLSWDGNAETTPEL